MARVLICGTLAYDDIGEFDSALAPHTRNVKLTRLHRSFGGCAMNIAYNLAGLGHETLPFVYVGDDYAGGYARHVAARGISETGIFHLPGTPCARGIILTGSDGAQFTAFFPGPSGATRWQADIQGLLGGPMAGSVDAAVIAPDVPEKMRGCARLLRDLPLSIWCPGQYAELLEPEDVRATVDAVDLIIANRHEWAALCRRVVPVHLLDAGRRAFVTDGPGPVEILPEGARVPVPAAPETAAPEAAHDPTGCGDAFAAGVVHGLLAGWSAAGAAALGIRLAGLCLRERGAQTHEVILAAAAPTTTC